MVLKRLLVTALCTLGLGALATGPAFAQNDIPAPDSLTNVADCIRAYGAMTADPADITKLTEVTSTTVAPADTSYDTNRFNPIDSGTSAAIACTGTTVGSGRNAVTVPALSTVFAQARSRLALLDPTDDDFDADLAALRNDYGGPVFSLLYDEYVAQLALDKAHDDFRTAFDPPATGQGANQVDPPSLATLLAAYNAIDIDEAATENAVRTSGVLASSVTLPAVTRNAGGMATGYSGTIPTGVPVTANSETFSTLEPLLTRIESLSSTVKDYTDLLNSDFNLLPGERQFFQDTKAAAESALVGLKALQARAENGQALPSAATDAERATARTAAGDFNTRFNQLKSLRSKVNEEIDDFTDARDALRSAMTNPGQHLDQLAKAAAQSAADAVSNQRPQSEIDDLRKISTTANNIKRNYDALVGDGTVPQAKLLTSLVGQDDTGQALLDAVAQTYGETTANEGRLDSLLRTETAEDGTETEAGRIVDIENSVKTLMGDDSSGGISQLQEDVAALTAMDDPETMEDETGAVTKNANEITKIDGRAAKNESDITSLGGRVTANEEDLDRAWMDLYGSERGVETQHDDLAACSSTGLLSVATCADARSRHNEADIEGINDKLMDKKEYIDNLAAEIGVDPVTGEGTGEGGMSRIDKNAADIAAETKARMDADTALGGRIDTESSERMAADTALGGRIDTESSERMAADTALGGRIDTESSERKAADTALDGRIDAEEMARMNADTALDGRIDAEEMARMNADTALGGRIDAEEMARADADMALGMRIDGEAMARADADVMLGGMIMAEEMARMEADTALGGRISSNADAIAANMNSIGQNASAISDNRNMIGELSDDLDVVRAGVAASMALAGMPAINGRGIAIGVGSYDGESAFAVGFQIQGEQASFKIGVTSSGGETGASAGVGFNF